MKLFLKFTGFICLLFPLLFSCKELSKQEKFQEIITSDQYHIRLHHYGGITGYSTKLYKVQTGKYPILIQDEGTKYQTYIRLSNTRHALMDTFLTHSISSHNPNKIMRGGCMFMDQKYDFINGKYSIQLKPNHIAVDAFNELIDEFSY